MDATEKISRLRRDVALEQYEVDARDIAEAMLRRLEPVNWGPTPAIAEVARADAPQIRLVHRHHHHSPAG